MAKNTSKKATANLKKNFILDTNILITYPKAITCFEDNNVWITHTTLKELDKKKTSLGETGYGARRAIREIDKITENQDLVKGIKLESGGMFYISKETNINKPLPTGEIPSSPDDKIIATVITLQTANTKAVSSGKAQKERFILVTNDIAMKLNASLCCCEVQNFLREYVDERSLYTGQRECYVPTGIINNLYKHKTIDNKNIIENPIENEFFVLKSNTDANSSALAIYQNRKINLIMPKPVFGVKAYNASQKFALHALTAPVEEIPFVILQGVAGTAKTFLSLAAGMEQVHLPGDKEQTTYNKVLISRNNVTSDDDFGYLPGTIEEKMQPLLAPFYDNLESLIRGNDNALSNEDVQMQLDDILETKLISVCPLAYMRGRSITNSYLIVDEAQNATRSQIKDIITRAGRNCKIIICGDPNQIDNPSLDKWNNGLVFAADCMKNSKLCAQLLFNKEDSVRSPLAVEALTRMPL